MFIFAINQGFIIPTAAKMCYTFKTEMQRAVVLRGLRLPTINFPKGNSASAPMSTSNLSLPYRLRFQQVQITS